MISRTEESMTGRPKFTRRLLKPGLAVAAVALLVGAGAGAAIESHTVGSYGRGLWWAISLMTTVGFIGPPPTTTAGAVVSVILMVTGFLLLSLLSAAMASLFVRQDVEPVEERELSAEREISMQLADIATRLETLEAQLAQVGQRLTTSFDVDGSSPATGEDA